MKYIFKKKKRNFAKNLINYTIKHVKYDFAVSSVSGRNISTVEYRKCKNVDSYCNPKRVRSH